MKRLSEPEFLATFGKPMQRVPSTEGVPFEFWSYFDGIPADDFESHDCSDGQVTYVWNNPAGTFQHVLVNSEDKNVFMVLVLDLKANAVLGHRLLNLKSLYGLAQ